MRDLAGKQPLDGKTIVVEVVTAVNENAKYLNCLPFFIEFWEQSNGVFPEIVFSPKVLIFGEVAEASIHGYERHIERISVECDTAFAAQNARSLWGSLSSADVVATTDIDMLPLDLRLFRTSANRVLKQAHSFVVSRDVLAKGQYPICYSFARPETWNHIFQIRDHDNLVERLHRLWNDLGQSTGYSSQHGSDGWFFDQEYLYNQVERARQIGSVDLVKLKDKDTGHRRLDRIFLGGHFRWLQFWGILFSRFTDYHVHHPVAKYRRFLKAVFCLRQISLHKHRGFREFAPQ